MSKKAAETKKAKPAEVPKEAAKPAEIEKPEKVEKKGKREKKKKKEKGIFSVYKIENDKIVRLRPTCERCGPGYFMAEHGDRFTCGHCGFTRYKIAAQ